MSLYAFRSFPIEVWYVCVYHKEQYWKQDHLLKPKQSKTQRIETEVDLRETAHLYLK